MYPIWLPVSSEVLPHTFSANFCAWSFPIAPFSVGSSDVLADVAGVDDGDVLGVVFSSL